MKRHISNHPLCLKRVLLLPEVLVDEIQSYIPKNIIVFLSKVNYKKYHYLIEKQLHAKCVYDNYIRYTLRNKLSFIFETVLDENWNKWTMFSKNNNNHYRYKSNIYPNYISLLWDLCNEYESTNCKNLIYLALNKDNKNKYKKKIKHNPWRI